MKKSLRLVCVKSFCVCFLAFIGFDASISETFALSRDVTPEHLLQRTDLVILGKVKCKTTEEHPFIAGTTNGIKTTYRTVEIILTEYDIELEKSYKQEFGESNITMTSLGGFLSDGRGTTDSKYFDLSVGERIIAFLAFDERNEVWRVVGGSQGIFRIEEDSSHPESPRVTSAYTGHLVSHSPSEPDHKERNANLTLQILLDIIEGELEK